jgi:hypothetical protein
MGFLRTSLITASIMVGLMLVIFLMYARTYRYKLGRIGGRAAKKYADDMGINSATTEVRSRKLTWNGDKAVITFDLLNVKSPFNVIGSTIGEFRVTTDPSKCVMEKTIQMVNGVPTQTVTGADCIVV